MSHVYVSRRSVLLCFAAAGLLFLVGQLFLMKWASKPGFNWLNFWRGDIHQHIKTVSPYRATKLFAGATAMFNIPVFLIEPECLTNFSLLWRVDSNKLYSGQCKNLCGGRNVTTFGILDARLISNDFLKYLTEKIKVKWTVFFGSDPRLITIANQETREIPLHYLLEYYGQFIHLVVFYERSGSYLWHGTVGEDAPKTLQRAPRSSCFKDLNLKRLKFGGTFAGAFEKMEFKMTVLDGVHLRIPKDVTSFLEQIPFSRFLECNFRQANAFRAKYGRDESEGAEGFRNLAKELLEKGKRILDESGIRFWLSSGTCLGWFRECDIIAHSQDVDFGMWITDYKSSVVSEFDSRGLTLKHQFGKISDSFELSFVDNGMKLDIFFFYNEKDHVWNGGTEVRSGKKFKYIFPKFTLCWAELLGLKVRVPCDTRRYIEANYGTEWNKKITTWDWKSSPPNVRPNGQWNQDEWNQVIQVY